MPYFHNNQIMEIDQNHDTKIIVINQEFKGNNFQIKSKTNILNQDSESEEESV